MKRLFLLCVFLLFTVTAVVAQPFTISGSVWDTLNNNALQRASVVLIRAKDSMLATHTRTSPAGSFTARVPGVGKYVIRISFPTFADYSDVIDVKGNADLGIVPLISKSMLLKEYVITRQVAAIKIKGDTTEYVADSFKTKEGATVEDLLKKLPGIQVDKNGQVIAQGATVQKILVDGEEFFSDDPKVVTRGLQADAVTKVQMFDKKSDQAEFTGVDDGEKIKTINLQLKEDRKRGYFGKVDAGGGTGGFFENQGMINAFKGKRQLSGFGIVANTAKAGLNWDDKDKIGAGSNNNVISDDGNTYFVANGDEDNFAGWDGRYNGEGLPKTWTGGAHYANKWKDGNHHLSANYRYARQEVEVTGENLVQNTLPGDTVRVNDQVKNQFSDARRNAVDVLYEWKIDTNTTIKVTSEGGTKLSHTASTFDVNALVIDGDDTLRGRTNRSIANDADAQFLNTSFLFKKKFAKKGRTVSVDLKENYKDTKNEGLFKATTLTDIANPSTGFSANQRKVSNTNTASFSGKAIYTEPLSKVFSVEADYSYMLNNSSSLNYSYDADGAGTFSDVLNSTFSSNYKYNIQSNVAGAFLKYDSKTIKYSLGSDVSQTRFLQRDVLNGDTSKVYNYLNLFPRANFNYNPSKQTSFSLSYNGKTRQPAINQVQPLRQNTDPLNLTIGNPALRQEFSNTFSTRFNHNKILKGRYFWSGLTFNTVSDAITTSLVTTGAQTTTQYINMNGNYSVNGYMGYHHGIPKLKMSIGTNSNWNLNHNNNMVNGIVNASDYGNVSVNPYIRYEEDEKFEFGYDVEPIYYLSRSSVSTVVTDYWIFVHDVKGMVMLPKKIEIGSDAELRVRQKTEVFTTNNNVLKWNAYVTKKFLKKGQLAVKLAVYDILNQNIGFARDAKANTITQNTYNTIRRYGMLSVIWNFNHSPMGAAGSETN
jgi:hypothetical protein